MTEVRVRRELVGRGGESSLVEAAITDGHRLVLIDGEPGAGKTRLLEHLVGRAHAAGRTVLTGSVVAAAYGVCGVRQQHHGQPADPVDDQ